jgi:hypothetical protein
VNSGGDHGGGHYPPLPPAAPMVERPRPSRPGTASPGGAPGRRGRGAAPLPGDRRFPDPQLL